MASGLATLMEADASRASLMRLNGATDGNWETTLAASTASLEGAVRRHAVRVFDGSLKTDDAASCGARLWECLTYHLNAGEAGRFHSLEALILTCESGKLFPGPPEDLIADVILAQALQRGQNRAALYFQERFMPLVQKTASRFGKDYAAESENYMADLYFPRKAKPSRISTYKGQTPLKYWLRQVVTRHILSQIRRTKDHVAIDEAPEVADHAAASRTDSVDCRELLSPLLRRAVAKTSPDDRLLLKLLVVDKVPQKAVAEQYGRDSGNITRRRQRAAGEILEALKAEANAKRSQTHVDECLKSVLAGEDAELTLVLADLITSGLTSGAASSEAPR